MHCLSICCIQVRAKIDAKPDNWQLVLPREEDFIKVKPPPVTFKTEEQWGQLKLTMDPSGVQYNNRPDVDPDNQRWMDLKAACEGALQWDRELKTWYARGKQKKCMKVYEMIKKVQSLSCNTSQQTVVFRHLQKHGRKLS